jgi:hypothetical protein
MIYAMVKHAVKINSAYPTLANLYMIQVKQLVCFVLIKYMAIIAITMNATRTVIAFQAHVTINYAPSVQYMVIYFVTMIIVLKIMSVLQTTVSMEFVQDVQTQ